jgi:hypothetical protein
MSLLEELCHVVIGIYLSACIVSMGVGFLDAQYDAGLCKNSPTILGKYTGMAEVLDLGCKLGQRVEE